MTQGKQVTSTEELEQEVKLLQQVTLALEKDLAARQDADIIVELEKQLGSIPDNKNK